MRMGVVLLLHNESAGGGGRGEGNGSTESKIITQRGRVRAIFVVSLYSTFF